MRGLTKKIVGARRTQIVLLVCTERRGEIALSKSTFDRRDRLVVGRSAGCDLVIDDDSVSDRHLELYVSAAGNWLVEGLGGGCTRLNGRDIDWREPVGVDDVITVGAAEIVIAELR